MIDFELKDIETLLDVPYRHWCHYSEKFTGGDALRSALDNGWEPHEIVFKQAYGLSGGRWVYVYHVPLHRNGITVRMGVLENPRVIQLLQAMNMQVVQLQEVKEQRYSRWITAPVYPVFSF